jgi:hypothetical protein
MLRRRSALEKVVRTGWGGTYADSFTHAQLFRSYGPTYFGMVDAQLFSSEIDSNIINKPWVWLTMAQGNAMTTEPGHTDFCWRLAEDVQTDARMTRVANFGGSLPGKGNTQFKIYLDRGWFHAPVLLKTDSADAPMLRIIGHPTQISATEWEYVVQLQTGDPNAWLDPKYLEPNRRVIDGGTSIVDELNYEFGGDYFGSVFELMSHIGYVARKVEVTDKFIRLEMDGKSANMSYGISGNGGTYKDGKAVSSGYLYQPGLDDKTTSKVLQKGSFISMAEARLAERLSEDKNFMMEFGQNEVSYHPVNKRPMKVAPGWRQIRKDGHFKPHNGSLTLYDIYDRIQTIFTTRYGVGEPTVILRTGKGGIEFFSRLVKDEAGLSPFTLLDSFFVSRTQSEISPNSLKFGAQFTEILMPNGITLKVMYDPTKDNPRYYPEKVPGTNYSYESFTFDVLDLGNTDAAPSGARTRSNIAMVYEDAYESYFMVSNVYDIMNGAKKSGETVAVLDKEAGIYRESSCALAVWDTSRILSMPYLAS